MSPSPYFTILFLLVAAILQSTAAPRLAVAGARPDLMLTSVVSWTVLAALRARELEYAGESPGLTRGINDGIVWGFTGGMFLDLLSGAPLGASALALMAAALVAGVVGIGVTIPAPLLVALMTALGTLVYHLFFLATITLMGYPVFWDADMTRVVLPSMALNLLLVPLVYGLLSAVDRRTSRERLQW